MTLDEAKTELATRLRALDATGPSGFEGLMRDILTEVTAQTFSLAKSGPQGGSDVRSVGTNTFRIGLEGKRYGEQTRLGLDELRAKLLDAATQDDPVDLWILAATREIWANDQEELEKAAAAHGLATLVLDWPGGATLPDLAVLSASAPTAVQHHLGQDVALDGAFAAIRAHPGFAEAQDRLRKRLTSAEIGYAAANAAMSKWILAGLASEADAGSRLGGRGHSLLAEADKLVLRKTLRDDLDRWFHTAAPGALIGDEGMGKTWSFLSWWTDKGTGADDLPLTLFVSAKDIRDETAEELIVRLLATRLEMRDADFWRRRVGQWRRATVDKPQLILVIDGLNQNWTKTDWADFLQPLYDQRWNGRVRVLMTCWPDHWSHLQGLAPLMPEPTEIPVGPFTDAELDLVLASHGLSRGRFTEPMLLLMKVPRLSKRAIARHEALAESGDITPERLAYEDWKHRISRRGAALAIGDAEFRTFASELGKELKVSVDGSVFTRKDLLDRLGRDSGRDRTDLSETLGEIVAGRWLEAGETPHQFRVHPQLTPFVLGLTLAGELKGMSDDAQAAAAVAEFLDPFKGQSLGVAILRAATTVALLDPQIGRGARRAILKRWLAEQNFLQPDFDAYWRLIGLDVDLVCQNIEETWLAREGSGAFNDEILIKGMAQAYCFPQVASHLVDRVERWLGWLWEDPDQGRFLGRVDPASERSIKNRARTKANLDRWLAAASTQWPRVALRPDGDVSWFSHRVFGMLSFLPRQPFARAYVAWGLSRAVMGVPRHIDEAGWVFRLNEHDAEAFGPDMDREIERLLTAGDDICVTAAAYLLEALGHAEAQRRLDALGTREEPEPSPAPRPWTDPRDPAEHPSKINGIQPIDGTQLWMHHRQNGDADVRFERDKPSLARVDPRAFQAIAEAAAGSAHTRTWDQLWSLLDKLRRVMILITPEGRQTIVEAVDRVLANGDIKEAAELHWWRARRLELLLWSASTEEQLTIIRSECQDANELAHLAESLPWPDKEVLRQQLPHFGAADTKQGKMVRLFYLTKRAGEGTLREWDGLAAHISDPDDDVRRLAWQLASMTENPAVLEAVAASGRAASDEAGRAERLYGSVALLAASQVLHRPELLARADPETVGLQLLRNPDDAAALAGYEQFVRTALEGAAVIRPGPIADHWVAHDQPLRTLLTHSADSFLPWLSGWLDRIGDIPNTALFSGEFPLVTLCRALFHAGQPQAEQLWEKLREAVAGGIFKNPDIMQLPMVAPAGEAWDSVRMKVLGSARTDQELALAARNAIKCGHAPWLGRVIREGVASGRAAETARAYTLLGFADATPHFDAVWESVSKTAPARGWLAEVLRVSRGHYDRNRWARHWYQAYLNAGSAVDAYAAYELLLSCADKRVVQWARGADLNGRDEYLRRHWDANATDLDAVIKKKHEGLKDTLFFTRTMPQTHAPWL